MSQLQDKVAVVTGAASGIGRACAVALANDGADVAVLDINEAGLAETQALVEATGVKCQVVPVDLLDRSAIKAAIAEVRQKLGFIEILHNNAGGPARSATRSFPNASTDQWDEVYALNLRAAADCTREVINEMKQMRCGRIINTSSEQAFRGGPGSTDYSASKAGLLGFTRSLALEVARYNITVNAVCPGAIRTPMATSLPEEHQQATLVSIPMGRLGEPEEVAHAVSFLASPGASYVTGTYLLVAGGRTLH